MPVKIVSWRQRSGPPYRRLTTSPQMLQMLPTLPDRMTSPMQSLSLTARVPFLLTARIMKCQYRKKRRARAASTPLSFLPPPLSSACIRTVQLPPTENRHTKKITTVTRRRRVKRTTWSPHLLVLFIQSRKWILEETTLVQHLNVQDLQRSVVPAMWIALMTTVKSSKIWMAFVW